MRNKAVFYHYRQQASNGLYEITDSVRINVIVEAHSATEANTIAWKVGLYFTYNDTRIFRGLDCKHCKDRWFRQVYDFAGKDHPVLYGKLPIILVPLEFKEWADTVIYYGGLDNLRRLYAFGPDIYREGIPVPPEVAEDLKNRGGVTIGRKIIGGGWRMGYAHPDKPWVLAATREQQEALSHAYSQDRTEAVAPGA